jgi:uncharacterized SAM-binding protein YcdF (DUF218 family)
VSSAQPDVIILLGSPNGEDGQLYSVALERCQRALEEYHLRGNCKILPTGGFGAHFNTTDRPHAWYLKAWLVAHGVPEQDVLPFAESRNTIQDAALSYPIVRGHGARRAIVVTSDYHAARARYVFEHLYRDVALEFAVCATDPDCCDLDLVALQAHERVALARLKARGFPKTEADLAVSHPGQNGTTGL